MLKQLFSAENLFGGFFKKEASATQLTFNRLQVGVETQHLNGEIKQLVNRESLQSPAQVKDLLKTLKNHIKQWNLNGEQVASLVMPLEQAAMDIVIDVGMTPQGQYKHVVAEYASHAASELRKIRDAYISPGTVVTTNPRYRITGENKKEVKKETARLLKNVGAPENYIIPDLTK